MVGSPSEDRSAGEVAHRGAEDCRWALVLSQ
jgi:hypothetical protein